MLVFFASRIPHILGRDSKLSINQLYLLIIRGYLMIMITTADVQSIGHYLSVDKYPVISGFMKGNQFSVVYEESYTLTLVKQCILQV